MVAEVVELGEVGLVATVVEDEGKEEEGGLKLC